MNELTENQTEQLTIDSVLDAPKSSAKAPKKAQANQALALLPKMIQASIWGQYEAAETLALEMAETLSDSHPVVANKIVKICSARAKPIKHVQKPDSLLQFGDARHGLDQVILPEPIHRECRKIIQEHDKVSELAKFDLKPRHKALLYGPPGNGKTLLAEALAKEMNVPFLQTKYAGLIESYLGSTGKNLQTIFEYAATAPCVLFMDEFDGVAIDRADSKDVGEIRRVTNQLLILLDRLPSTCLFVAATNANELLDRAIQRRFDYVIEIPKPGIELRKRCVQAQLHPSLTPGHDLSDKVEIIAGLPIENLSGFVQFCQRIRRDLVLNEGLGVNQLIVEAQIRV